MDTRTQKRHAIKIIKNNKHYFSNFRTTKNEFEILAQLSHPNIVKVFSFASNGAKSLEEIATYMVSEFAKYGDVFDWVAQTGYFSDRTARYFFRSLISALEYLHAAGFTHRDIKPQNLLLDSEFNLKLADFGFSGNLSGKFGNGELRDYLGTKGYMAPEIIKRVPYSGSSVDIFAAGVVLFIMKAGHPPFTQADCDTDPFYNLLSNKNYEKFWILHSKGKPKNFFSLDFKNLIEYILHPDPSQRPTIAEIKSHRWFRKPTGGKAAVQRELGKKRNVLLKGISFSIQEEETENVLKVLNRSKTDK